MSLLARSRAAALALATSSRSTKPDTGQTQSTLSGPASSSLPPASHTFHRRLNGHASAARASAARDRPSPSCSRGSERAPGVPPGVAPPGVAPPGVTAKPQDEEELLAVSGVGPSFREKYGSDVLRLISQHA